MRLGLMVLFGLLLGVVLSAELVAKNREKPTKKRFIPFVIPKKDELSKEQQVREGSIINVPTRCPPNMLKVGQRCRTVY